MSHFDLLLKKIENREAKICVVGLGYVGLPLAVAFAKVGYFVYGFDTNIKRIKRLKTAKLYILDVDPKEVLNLINKNKFLPTTDEKNLKEADVIIICVPTPLRKVKTPDISYIILAAKTIKKYLRTSQLIILESTSYPTTTREILVPILKQSKLEEEKDFFVCFSPERVNPGDKKFPLTKITKIVGGISEKSTILAKNLYQKIVPSVFCVSCPEVAETTKLLENTFRLVNIALVNEFAILANKLKIDIWEVIEAAKTKPFGFMPFYPGPGLGGHCIPVDPVYLSWKAKKIGFKTNMIDLALYINRFMPTYIVQRTEKALKEKKLNLKDAKILIIGVTYKKDVKDLRESPALEIIELLDKKCKCVDFLDPLISYLKINDIDKKSINLTATSLKKYDCVIIVTDHSSLNYQLIKKHSKFIFDTRNVYKKIYPNIMRL